MEVIEFDQSFWKIQGFITPIKMIMECLHLSVTDLEADLDSLPAVTLSPEDWPAMKEELLNALTVTPKAFQYLSYNQGLWICRFLAQKYNPKMLGSAMNEYAEIDTVLSICSDLRAQIIRYSFNGPTMEMVKEKLGNLNKLLRGRAWISGKQATVADFVFCGLVDLLRYFRKDILDNYPQCKRIIKKIHGIPGMVKYTKQSDDVTQ